MSGGSRGIVGRIWEKICDLLINSDAVKVTTDQMQFVDGKLRTTGEDASGGGGDLQPVIDELIELNSKVSLDDTLDLVSTEATQELIRQLLVLLNAKDYATETTLAQINQGVSLTGIDSKLLQVDAVGSTTYLGYADPGTVTSSVTWAIKRIIETGNDVSITWADGNNNFDNTWDNRLILLYS